MPGQMLTAFKARLDALRRNFTGGQLVLIGVLTALLILGGSWFFNWVTRPDYALLFGNLNSKDAAAIVDKLEADGTPYQLADGGSSILIPADKRDTERLALAGDGLLPTGNSEGYKILDSQGLTTSSFREQIDYQRALEGELANTISAMDGVSAVSVHLVLPQDQLYSDQQTPATASVMLTTGRSLDQDGVDAITHLVAGAVKGLDVAKVTVTDSTGHLLTADAATGASTRSQQMSTAVSDQLSRAAENMLTRVLGPGRAVVQVNASLDFDEHSSQSETYDPSKQAIIKQQGSGESYTNSNGNSTGPLTTANTDGTVGSGSDSDNSQYSKDSTNVEYGVTRILSQDKAAPGRISRLTAAVLVDQTAMAGVSTEQVQKLVEAAIGMDSKRGDTVVVNPAKFDTAAAAGTPATAAAPAAAANPMNYIQYGAGAAILLIVLLALFVAARRGRVVDIPLSSDLLNSPEAGSRRTGRGGRGVLAEPDPGSPDYDADIDLTGMSDADRLLRRIDRHPDRAAAALRGWMAEDNVNEDRR